MRKPLFYFLFFCACLNCSGQTNTIRKATDINYASAPTESQVIATWGSPDAYAGSNNQYWVYSVKDGERWMEFDAKSPHHLAGVLRMPPANKAAHLTGGRKLSDLTITNGITYSQVTAVWGRPDYFPPTGVEYFAYHLEDCQDIWFEFDFRPPYRALMAHLMDPRTRHHESLF